VGAGTAERVALVLCSAAAYGVGFGVNRGGPITFVLIVISIWAGLRLPTRFVVLHNLVLGMAAVFFTLRGTGPFAIVADHSARALIAQLYVGVIALVGLVLALGRDERVTLMRSLEWEKGELAAQRERANQRAELLSVILDSMADGVSVIDSEGRVVLWNESTARILADRVTSDDDVTDIGRYGMLALDGTPIPHDETVYARAIAGEEVVSQDVLIRSRGIAGEKIVTVTATRLAGEGGQPRAVLVLHDVTAERRLRDELASFAGVVAHDLQSPLTIVEAWGANVADALETGYEGSTTVAEDGVRRIRRAGSRMRDLINDLLAYATARDAALRSELLRLDTLVNDIAVTRVDAAVASGAPVPRFTIEALPSVLGDLCLVRQLLDNLVGNAVKYTAPGVTPHVTVTARPTGPDHTEITIADNGIGIPAGQHEAIFGNFHRAHAGAAYAGTGLGLAICRRIVQRHGGTIRAEDNPSGGTRVVFVLPHAPAERAGTRRTAGAASARTE
jgi:signal transduction histidine kinase